MNGYWTSIAESPFKAASERVSRDLSIRGQVVLEEGYQSVQSGC